MNRTWLAVFATVLLACGWTEEIRDAKRPRETPPTPPTTTTEDRPPAPPPEGSCTSFSLSFGPVTLPPGVKGRPYEVRIMDHAEDGWRGASYEASSVPPGLEVTERYEAFVLRGVPAKAGEFEMTIMAVHEHLPDGCYTMPDPHTFELVVYETDADRDAGANEAGD